MGRTVGNIDRGECEGNLGQVGEDEGMGQLLIVYLTI